MSWLAIASATQKTPMPHRRILKASLKRGALVAASNWQVTLIQATADALLKILIGTPVVGGVFLVALVLGTEPGALLTGDWRELVPTIVTALLSRPAVLVLFVLAVAVVGVGGSLFVFLIKAGTVATLAHSEREAGPVEDEPVHLESLVQCSRFSVDGFIQGARMHFPAYARLGLALMGIYAASAVGYLMVVSTGSVAGTIAMTLLFVAWITLVNFLYLLVQVVIAAESSGVVSSLWRAGAFVRHEARTIGAVFLVVLAVVVAATGASLVAAAALGLIWFVPFVGLAVVPLQLLASLLRALVFQFIGLTSVGAYLKIYRGFTLSSDRPDLAPYSRISQPVSHL